jgi:hypothetical protein
MQGEMSFVCAYQLVSCLDWMSTAYLPIDAAHAYNLVISRTMQESVFVPMLHAC